MTIEAKEKLDRRQFILIADSGLSVACFVQIEELQSEQLKSSNSAKEYSVKLACYVKQLDEKDNKLKKMNSERHKHLEEVFEMK